MEGRAKLAKAGVILNDFMRATDVAPSLIGSRDREKAARMMAAIEAVNVRFGWGAITPAAAGMKKPWATIPRAHPRQRWHVLLARAARQGSRAGVRRLLAQRPRPQPPARGPEAHRSAFLVGRIKDVMPSPDHSSRWLITFSKYADVSVPGVTGAGQRNPVSYGSLDDFGIDPATLNWVPMPPVDPTTFRTEDDVEDEDDADDGEGAVEPGSVGPRAEPEPLRLTISQAKAGLALNFGVSQEAVDITIRG